MQPPKSPRKRGRPSLGLSEAQLRARLREQNRVASQGRRAKLAAAGAVEIRLVLTGEDAATFTRLQEAQRGPVADFPRRALLCGAKFLANSGHPAGRKPGKNQSAPQAATMARESPLR